MASRNLTVFIADLKGFTPRTASSSRQELNTLLSRFRKLITPVIERCGGHVVKELGDAFMVTFESPTNAVAAGALLQRLLGDRNAGVVDEERIDVRVAIHCGEVEVSANDIIGDAVNVASRVEGVAEVGEVYFTEAVFLTMNRSEVPSAEVGERVLKGIEKPVKLYRVLQDPADERYLRLLAGQPLEGAESRSRRRSRLIVGLIVLLLLTIGGLALTAWYIYDLPLTRARALMEQGHHAEAVDSLTRAYDRKVPDPQALKLIAEAAGKAIDARIARNDFAGARELALRWCERWSSLRELPVKVALAEARHLSASGQHQDAANALRTAAEQYDDWRLHLQLSRLHARNDVYLLRKGKPRHWGKYDTAVEEIGQTIRLLPPGKPLPKEVKEELWKRFRDQPVGFGRITSVHHYMIKVREMAARHLLPEYRGQMVAACAAEAPKLRENSFAVLSAAGDLKGVDVLAYHAWTAGSKGSPVKTRAASAAYVKANAKNDAEKQRVAGILKKLKAELDARRYTDRKVLATIAEVLTALGLAE